MKLYTQMRNTGIALFSGLALLSFAGAVSGCSNNVEDGLYAADASNISLDVTAEGFSNGLYKIGAEQSDPLFTVTCTTRWTVDVTDCEGAWCQISYGNSESGEGSHIGDGTFRIEVAPNRSQDERDCNVTVYAVDRDGTHIPGLSKEIHVIQDRQSISIDYDGQEIRYQGAIAGTLPAVTVVSNQAWTVSSSHSWVKIVPGEGMNGDSYTPPAGSDTEISITFSFQVEPNPGTTVRNAELTFSSPTSAFTPIRRTITQLAATETFFITPTEYSNVSSEGGDLEFRIYSPLDGWTATSGESWAVVETPSAPASSDPVTLKVKVSANEEYKERTVLITVSRDGGKGNTPLTIIQAAKTDKFDVLPMEVPLQSYSGGTVDFSIYSPSERWTVEVWPSSEWVSLNTNGGAASENTMTLAATLAQNPTNVTREVILIFKRDNGREGKEVTLRQAANPNVSELPDPDPSPRVSAPWLVSGWSYVKAQLMAYYVSPVIGLTGCGIELSYSDGVIDVPGQLVSDGSLSATATDLRPNTTYSATAYVTYVSAGETVRIHGESTSFTTPDRNGQPGTTPGIGDNTPPSVN